MRSVGRMVAWQEVGLTRNNRLASNTACLPDPATNRRGVRPALVVKKDWFNRGTVLAAVCPMTNTDRDFPFHVPVPGDSSLTGFIMLEGVKSIDFHVRRARRSRHTSDKLLSNVLSILDACIY